MFILESFGPRTRAGFAYGVCLLLAAWTWAEPAVGSVQYQFERLADELGGRQSSIYDLFQDPDGLIWLAGDTDGLLRFDGNEFTSWNEGFAADLTRANVSTQVITPAGRLWVGSWGNGLQYWDRQQERYVAFLADADDPDALADNRVQRLMVDSGGRVWVGTAAGINLIDPDDPDRLRRFARDDPDHPLFGERIWGMVEHDDGFWLATTGGVYWLSPDLLHWRHYLLDLEAAEVFERGAEVRTIARVHGEIWAGSQLGVFRHDAAGDRFVQIGFDDGVARPMPRVNVILESAQGHVWIGAFDGLYLIDPTRRRFQRQGEAWNRIADVDIRSMLEDSEGNLWIGSRDQGLIHGWRTQTVFSPLVRQMPDNLAELGRRLTSAVLFDDRDRLWLSVPGGMLRRDAADQWRYWEFPSEIGVRRVEGLRQAPDGRIWIGTNDGLFSIGADDQLRAESRIYELLGVGTLPVNSLYVHDDGTLWVSLWQYGLVEWHPETEHTRVFLEQLRRLRGDLVYQLTRDDRGQIWAATRYSGLFRFNGDEFEAIELQIGHQLDAPTLYCVVPEQPDRLWLCTEDGLVRYDLARAEHQVFGSLQGLPVERITGFFLDPLGSAWALTAQGVARKLPDSERFVSYGLGDGLPGLGLQRNAVHSNADGLLVMGTSHGAVQVDPAAPPRGLNQPPTVLSRLWIDGVERTRTLDLATPALSLPHDFRDLMIQVAVLDFHDPGRNLVRYRLRGFEAEFSPLTRDRIIRYMNLPPGSYVLEVEGWSSRGVPGQRPLEIPIEIAAPWWHSPLAWVSALLLLAALIWATIALRERQLRVSNERLSALVEARTQELGEANRRLRASATEDFLTGLLNRRGFTERFNAVQQLAIRQQAPLALVLFDLDHFKRINDEYGHDAGDHVLSAVAQIVKQRLRRADLAARWGGEEFLLALPDTDVAGAVGLCETLRTRLAEHDIRHKDQPIQVSATFGVVVRHGVSAPLESWVKAADGAMYTGKRGGRNKIVVAENSPHDGL